MVSSILCITINIIESMDAIVTAQDMIYKLSFSITFVNFNPHCNMRQFDFVMDDIGVRCAIMCWGNLSHNIIICFVQ